MKNTSMSKAAKGKAKKGSPYDLGNAKCPFDWPLKSSEGDGSSSKFTLEYEARGAVREEGMTVRWFTLFLLVPYKPSKEKAPFSERTPPDFPREVLDLICTVYRRLTLADLLKQPEVHEDRECPGPWALS